MFHVGQKIICVDVSENENLRLDAVYTVTWCGKYRFRSERYGVHLAETRQDIHSVPFFASRFRPVVERKTSISVFTEILRKNTKKQRASA